MLQQRTCASARHWSPRGAVPYLLLRLLVRLLVVLQSEQNEDTLAEEKWIEQPLDHFDPLLQAEGRRWQQRYFEVVLTQRQQHQQQKEQRFQQQEEEQDVPPIFVYIGGEAEISPKDITSGLQLVPVSLALTPLPLPLLLVFLELLSFLTALLCVLLLLH